MSATFARALCNWLFARRQKWRQIPARLATRPPAQAALSYNPPQHDRPGSPRLPQGTPVRSFVATMPRAKSLIASGRLYACYEAPRTRLSARRLQRKGPSADLIPFRAELDPPRRAKLEGEGLQPHWRFKLDTEEVPGTIWSRAQQWHEASQSIRCSCAPTGSYLTVSPRWSTTSTWRSRMWIPVARTMSPTPARRSRCSFALGAHAAARCRLRHLPLRVEPKKDQKKKNKKKKHKKKKKKKKKIKKKKKKRRRPQQTARFDVDRRSRSGGIERCDRRAAGPHRYRPIRSSRTSLDTYCYVDFARVGRAALASRRGRAHLSARTLHAFRMPSARGGLAPAL